MGKKAKQKKDIDVKQRNDIDLDTETQKNLKALVKTINELEMRLNIIVATYVNAKNKKGNYAISKDFTRLEITEKTK